MAEVKVEKSGELATTITDSSNLCCYSQRVCTLEKLKGFDFCHKHILEDKASPFKPCDFLAKSNGKRCNNPAPKLHDKEKSYCIIHTRKSELRRAVEQRRKKRQRNLRHVQVDSVDELMEDDYVESHRERKRRRTSSSTSHKSNDGVQKEEEEEDGGHSSDEGVECGIGGSLKVDSAWHGDVDSDAESVDSEEEDVLRHAGVWTLDEATRACCDKMVRLKTLYMSQYKRLVHVLQEKRRKYSQVIQAEEEEETGDCSLTPSEILGPLPYRRRHGAEALLHKQAKDKRLGTSPRHQNMPHLRCTYVADGIRCTDKILPLTKYCMKHIGHDPHQLLFQSCSFMSGDYETTCSNIIPRIYPHTTCRLHMRLPDKPARCDVQKDLEEARERDKLRKEKEKEMKEAELQKELERSQLITDTQAVLLPTRIDKELPIPKALQERSSALVPPPHPTQPTSTPETSTLPSTSTITKIQNTSTNVPPLVQVSGVEKMEVEPIPSEMPSSVAAARSAESTPQQMSSPASVDSPAAGIQTISPNQLVASLVAVCGGAGVASVLSSSASTSMASTPVAADSSGCASGASSTSASLALTSTTSRAPSSSSTSTGATTSITPASSDSVSVRPDSLKTLVPSSSVTATSLPETNVNSGISIGATSVSATLSTAKTYVATTTCLASTACNSAATTVAAVCSEGGASTSVTGKFTASSSTPSAVSSPLSTLVSPGTLQTASSNVPLKSITGTTKEKPALLENCHELEKHASSISALTVQAELPCSSGNDGPKKSVAFEKVSYESKDNSSKEDIGGQRGKVIQSASAGKDKAMVKEGLDDTSSYVDSESAKESKSSADVSVSSKSPLIEESKSSNT